MSTQDGSTLSLSSLRFKKNATLMLAQFADRLIGHVTGQADEVLERPLLDHK